MRYHYTIKTYEELIGWAKKFARGELHGLVVFGSAGLSKSHIFSLVLKDAFYHKIKGKLTAFDLYCQLYDMKDALILCDDTRQILKNGECITLLMQIAEHEARKLVQWNTATTSKKLRANDDEELDEGLPKSFHTASKLCILINRVDQENEDLEPIFSRSQLVRFVPSKAEVHKYVGAWFPKDKKRQTIYDYIGKHLHMIPIPDIRDYTGSVDIYDMNWREVLVERWSGDRALAAALLVYSDASLTTAEQKLSRFRRLNGGEGSMAKMYRLFGKLTPLDYDRVGYESGRIKSGKS